MEPDEKQRLLDEIDRLKAGISRLEKYEAVRIAETHEKEGAVARLEAMLSHAPVMMAHVDRDGRCRHMNRLFREGFALPRELAASAPRIRETLPGTLASDLELPSRHAREGREVRLCLPVTLPGWSQPQWFLIILRPIKDLLGTVEGYAMFMSDIQEQYEHERLQREQESLRVAREMARTVAHEFRQPLGALRLTFDLLQQPGLDPALAGKKLEKVPGYIDRMNSLVDRLLAVTQVRSKHYAGGVRIVDIDAETPEE
jgi:nitrogen-specific signal transduction histidine kinase